MNILEDFDSKSALKICLATLDNINKLILEDYPLDKKSNLDLIYPYFAKTNFKKMGGNLKSSINFLKKLMEDDNPNFSRIIKRKKQFSDWHDYLTKLHMYHYSQNRHEWNNLGLCLHYLIDCHYHIYTRLLASGETKCFWCQQKIGPWNNTLSDILIQKIPKILLYQDLFQSNDHQINEDRINSIFDNARFLMQKTIK